MPVDGEILWTDLRVWAYLAENIILLSGRASRRPDRLDPPAGRLAADVRSR